jgi:Spore Coat Protein U domain
MSCLGALSCRLRHLAALALLTVLATGASAQTLAVSAVVLSKSNCKFDTKNLVLDFGMINSGSGSNAVGNVGGTVTCNGGQASTVTLGFTLGNGTYSTGPGARRMRHATDATEFVPYSLSISPASATINKNGTLAFTVNGTSTPLQFQNAMAGSYSDIVTISVAP